MSRYLGRRDPWPLYRPCPSTVRVRNVERLRFPASNAQWRAGRAPSATSHVPNDAAVRSIESAGCSSFIRSEVTVRWLRCPRDFHSNSHTVSMLRLASRYRRVTAERWRQQGVGRFLEGMSRAHGGDDQKPGRSLRHVAPGVPNVRSSFWRRRLRLASFSPCVWSLAYNRNHFSETEITR